jgi:RNA polymerase sigma-70 factor (ECF subfamily)
VALKSSFSAAPSAGPAPALGQFLAETARGDRRAFQSLYQATSAKLFGIILRICRDRQISEDVLQETFLKIWRRAESYDRALGEPLTWLSVIARRTAIDAIRRAGPRPVAATDEFDPLDLIADPASEGPDGAELAALRKCLGTLEEEQRRCVLLAYYEGFSREELGEKFGRPVGTIKTWLFRGLALLRDCLGG